MAVLDEGISQIKKGTALDIMYNRLLAGFVQSSQETLPDFTGPDYVVEGVANEAKINAEINNYTDILRKNSAYLLANTICTSLSSEGGGTSGAFVSISGDSMTGLLQTLYGFKAGANGVKILDVYQTNEEEPSLRKSIVKVDGELHLNSNGLFINDKNVLSYYNDVLSLDAGNIALNGDVTCSGTITLGNLEISKDGIKYNNLDFYHSGNSNNSYVDWSMQNGTVYKNLNIRGNSTVGGNLQALNGVLLGYNNNSILKITQKGVAQLIGDFDIVDGGVKFNNNYIIHIKNTNVISFSASNKIMNLGDDNTLQITLQTGLYNDKGDVELISKFGGAYFPESFKAGHKMGSMLISTYSNSPEDSGIIAHRYLRLGSAEGPGIRSDNNSICIEAPFVYNDTEGAGMQIKEMRRTHIKYTVSSSLLAPLERVSSSCEFSTEADFYVFDKPIEGKTSIGISGTKTRITKNSLFFSDSVFWIALSDGVKHFGNIYTNDDIGSVEFSTGFAGSGWKIFTNKLTGNVVATFDEMTIRKKMRIYELEVQKNSAINGSLWVSDTCSGDIVEEIM